MKSTHDSDGHFANFNFVCVFYWLYTVTFFFFFFFLILGVAADEAARWRGCCRRWTVVHYHHQGLVWGVAVLGFVVWVCFFNGGMPALLFFLFFFN
jgi:hypothetical protein